MGEQSDKFIIFSRRHVRMKTNATLRAISLSATRQARSRTSRKASKEEISPLKGAIDVIFRNLVAQLSQVRGGASWYLRQGFLFAVDFGLTTGVMSPSLVCT
jgi:hypothetical protein